MKKLFIPLLGLALFCTMAPANSQEFKEHISKQLTLQKDASGSTIAIYNINGFVKVEGYAGNEVIIEVDKKITAKNNEALETGKKEFRLEFGQTNDSIIIYIAEPYDSRPNRSRNGNYRQIDYDYNLDFTIKVPLNVSLSASTINRGDVTVSGVGGPLDVHNINGAITINNAKGITKAHTINGNITVTYLNNPPGASSYHTINGDIVVNYQPDLAGDFEFKTMHGEFFTNFPDVTALPVTAIKNEQKDNNRTVYKLNKNTTIRIGAGGKNFKVETLNGNVYIKKQS